MERLPAIYVLASRPDGVLYIGVTSDLPKRVWEHKEHLVRGFTRRYNVTRLVYFEVFADMYSAISREKQLKAGSRAKKVALIEKLNPDWEDLYDQIVG